VDFSLFAAYPSGTSYVGLLFAASFVSTFGWALWSARVLLRDGRALVLTRVRAHRLRRWACSYPLLVDSRDLYEGKLARVRGTVEADTVGMTKLMGRPAVISEHLILGELGGIIDQGVQGHDFHLRLADGQVVRVKVAQAVAAGRLRLAHGTGESWEGQPLERTAGCRFSESWIAPGDEIEVFGRLRNSLDLRAQSAGPRLLPTSWSLSAPETQVMVVYGAHRAQPAVEDETRALPAA
jgi:hypothetical protein